jgi:hypothetical protein
MWQQRLRPLALDDLGEDGEAERLDVGAVGELGSVSVAGFS